MVVRFALCVLIYFGLVLSSAAQHAELDALEIQPSGDAYLKATRLRGLDRSVGYFDPTQPPPPLETRQQVRADRAEREPVEVSREGGRVGMMIVSAVILLAILYLFIRMSGGLTVSFAREGDEEDPRAQSRADVAPSAAEVPVAIDAILSMTDRREALVALCKLLLAQVVGAQGVLLHKSWTDRETLRRVAQSHPYRKALQALVFSSERVQFGGRDVSEEELRGHITELQPLWKSEQA